MFPLIFKSDIKYLKNKRIKEYDIVSGGYNISKAEGLVEDEDLQLKLDKSDKKKRQILLGLYARDNKNFTKNLHEGFRKYVNAFIVLNEINESNIVAINKDSVLLYNSNINRLKFKNVRFTCRGEYTSYLKLGNLQFFYSSVTKEKLVKGISIDSIKETLLEEVFTVLALAEANPREKVFKYLYDLRQSYVRKELTNTYYKELSSNNGYKFDRVVAGMQFYAENVTEDDVIFDQLDITYNYKNIIIPLCDIFI